MGSQYPKVVCFDALRHLDRVVKGSALRGPETLRKPLGTGEEFDARLDPTVRVQVARLRSKLKGRTS